MTVYDLESLDPEAENTSHGLIIRLVGENRRVLDVGCSTGYLGEALAGRGCVVDGVDRDPEAVALAAGRLHAARTVDLDAEDLAEALAGETYERIVLADVLEHLLDPAAVLRSAASLLAPGGEIVVSMPNVSHGSLRLALLQGRWETRDTGLLDRTHIRFFTRESMLALVQGAGFAVTELHATVVDPAGSEVQFDAAQLPEGIVGWVRAQPDSFHYQFVLRARLGEQDTAVPGVEPAVHLAEMDGIDETVLHAATVFELRRGFTELRAEIAQLRGAGATQAATDPELDGVRRQLEELREENAHLRRSVLNLRSNAIGTEAELGQARRDREEMRRELADARRDAHELRAAASWRVGQLLVSPLSKVRDALRGKA